MSICISGALQEMKNENEKEKIECEKRLSEMVAAISEQEINNIFLQICYVILDWKLGLVSCLVDYKRGRTLILGEKSIYVSILQNVSKGKDTLNKKCIHVLYIKL